MESGPDDAALVTRVIAGDQQAFEHLRAGNESAVRGTIRMQIGRAGDGGTYRIDHALVDDLVQVTWVQVWQKLPTYDPSRASFRVFARYWAKIMVRRYRNTPVGKGVETPISSLLGGDDGDDNAGDRFDRLGTPVSGINQPPDDPVPPEVYDELLAVTFATASPPHQLIVFGFTKAADLKPRQIAAELSNVPLRTLEAQLERTYLEQSDLPDERILPAFEPLRNRLRQRFDEVVQDATTLATYPALHARIVGETTLADYYTSEPTANLTQWWNSVRRCVLADLRRRESGPLAEMLRKSQRTTVTPTRGASQRISV